MYTPHIMYTPTPTCPACHRTQKIKKTCAYCGYEYREKDMPVTTLVLLLTGIVLAALAITYFIIKGMGI